MKTEITGNIIVVGNNIDTDQIYPGRFLAITDPKEIGSHCLCGVDEAIAANFPQGGIVVAGTNFGCGSSREHAPIALLNMGASAVIPDFLPQLHQLRPSADCLQGHQQGSERWSGADSGH